MIHHIFAQIYLILFDFYSSMIYLYFYLFMLFVDSSLQILLLLPLRYHFPILSFSQHETSRSPDFFSIALHAAPTVASRVRFFFY